MKKFWTFLFSTLIALSIAFYSKRSSELIAHKSNPTWKTFVKNTNLDVVGYKTTQKELKAARIPAPRREVAAVKSPFENDEHISFEQQAKISITPHLIAAESHSF